MASLNESDHLHLLPEAEEDGVDKREQQEGTLEVENNSVADDEDLLTEKIPTSQPMNIRGWADSAYALLHECLDDPNGTLSRQPTDEDWIRYGFTRRRIVNAALEYLITGNNILFINGEFFMLTVLKPSSQLSRECRQSHSQSDSESSSLSGSKAT